MSDGSDFDDGEIMMFPITDIDSNDSVNNNNENDADDEQENSYPKDNDNLVKFSLRQRRRSHNALLIPLQLKLNLNAKFNAADGLNNKINENGNTWNDTISHDTCTKLLKKKSNLNIIGLSLSIINAHLNIFDLSSNVFVGT